MVRQAICTLPAEAADEGDGMISKGVALARLAMALEVMDKQLAPRHDQRTLYAAAAIYALSNERWVEETPQVCEYLLDASIR